jgi:hypothetical protein
MMIVKSIDGWISADKKNVAAIHCKAGRCLFWLIYLQEKEEQEL